MLCMPQYLSGLVIYFFKNNIKIGHKKLYPLVQIIEDAVQTKTQIIIFVKSELNKSSFIVILVYSL